MVLVATTTTLVLVGLAGAGSVNDCHGVRYAYRERGLDLRDVPRQPRQGQTESSQIITYCQFGCRTFYPCWSFGWFVRLAALAHENSNAIDNT